MSKIRRIHLFNIVVEKPTMMNMVTLKFNNLMELWEFVKYLGKHFTTINFDSSELTGPFTQAEIDVAVKKMNGTIKQ